MPDWKKPAFGAALLAAALGVGAWLLLRQVSLSSLLAALAKVSPLWLLAGLGCMAAYEALEALGSRTILRSLGHRVAFRRCLGYSMLGFCGSSITPSSSGGQPFQVWAMRRDGIPVAHGSLNMLLLAVCYQTAMLLGGGIGLALLGGVPATGGVGLLLLLGVSVNLALTLGMAAVMFLPGPVRRLMSGGLGLLTRVGLVKRPEAAREKVEEGLAQYAAGARLIRSSPLLVIRVLALALLEVLALALVPWVVCLALGLKAGVAALATQMVLTLSVAAFPMPGAVGAAEGGFLVLFQAVFGTLAAPAMLLSRGISFYLFLPLCAVGAAVLNRRRFHGPGGGRKRLARPERAGRKGLPQPEKETMALESA